MTANNRPLGKTQREVLRCLTEYGPYPGRGWIWSTHAATCRIMNGLVQRGLTARDDRETYTVTDAGRVVARQLFPRLKERNPL